MYPPLLANFVRAEAPRGGEAPLVTTLFIPSLLFRAPLPPRNPPLRQPCGPRPLRQLVPTIALRGRHFRPSRTPHTATTIFRIYIDMGP